MLQPDLGDRLVGSLTLDLAARAVGLDVVDLAPRPELGDSRAVDRIGEIDVEDHMRLPSVPLIVSEPRACRPAEQHQRLADIEIGQEIGRQLQLRAIDRHLEILDRRPLERVEQRRGLVTTSPGEPMLV